MKLVFVPDSFKGTMSSTEITQILRKVAAIHFPSAEICGIPIADGGEGTLEAMLEAIDGEMRNAWVTGPLSDLVWARYGMTRDRHLAVIEMATASGLTLVPPACRNPLKTTSHGTGELIARVLKEGAEEIFIGIGGSATNDGGMGMLAALGAQFFDSQGKPLVDCGESLGKVAHIDLANLNPQLKTTAITVLCDVTNLLLGPDGATAIYGPQKGADGSMLGILEEGMSNYAKVFKQTHNIDIVSFPGVGAAGGLGAALGGVLNAVIKPGIDAILDLIRFDDVIADADLVVTGEGRIDTQSVKFGKVLKGITTRCARYGVPVAILTGSMESEAEMIYATASSSIMPTVSGPMSLNQALARSHELLENAADRMFRFIKIGYGMMEMERDRKR